jgi:hypothetical protein
MTDNGAVIGHKKWATDLTQLLRAVLGDERFPVDVEKLAMEVSASRFPKDPLKAIQGVTFLDLRAPYIRWATPVMAGL